MLPLIVQTYVADQAGTAGLESDALYSAGVEVGAADGGVGPLDDRLSKTLTARTMSKAATAGTL